MQIIAIIGVSLSMGRCLYAARNEEEAKLICSGLQMEGFIPAIAKMEVPDTFNEFYLQPPSAIKTPQPSMN